MQIAIALPPQSLKLNISVESDLLKEMYPKIPLILMTLHIDSMHLYCANGNRSPQGLYTAPESI